MFAAADPRVPRGCSVFKLPSLTCALSSRPAASSSSLYAWSYLSSWEGFLPLPPKLVVPVCSSWTSCPHPHIGHAQFACFANLCPQLDCQFLYRRWGMFRFGSPLPSALPYSVRRLPFMGRTVETLPHLRQGLYRVIVGAAFPLGRAAAEHSPRLWTLGNAWSVKYLGHRHNVTISFGNRGCEADKTNSQACQHSSCGAVTIIHLPLCSSKVLLNLIGAGPRKYFPSAATPWCLVSGSHWRRGEAFFSWFLCAPAEYLDPLGSAPWGKWGTAAATPVDSPPSTYTLLVSRARGTSPRTASRRWTAPCSSFPASRQAVLYMPASACCLWTSSGLVQPRKLFYQPQPLQRCSIPRLREAPFQVGRPCVPSLGTNIH